eukprot:g8040.t1
MLQDFNRAGRNDPFPSAVHSPVASPIVRQDGGSVPPQQPQQQPATPSRLLGTWQGQLTLSGMACSLTMEHVSDGPKPRFHAQLFCTQVNKFKLLGWCHVDKLDFERLDVLSMRPENDAGGVLTKLVKMMADTGNMRAAICEQQTGHANDDKWARVTGGTLFMCNAAVAHRHAARLTSAKSSKARRTGRALNAALAAATGCECLGFWSQL